MVIPILRPAIVLVIWSILMLFWATVVRIGDPATKSLGPDAGKRTAELAAAMSSRSQFKVDNYNHLMEQPTLFYAVCAVLALSGAGYGLNTALAWIYVGLRIAHSLVHATRNVVVARLGLFMTGTVCLLVMAIRAAVLLF